MPPKVAFPCSTCGKNVTKKTGGVRCCYCEHWSHAKCVDVSSEHLKFLEMPGNSWTCKTCRAVSKKVREEVQQLHLKVKDMREDIDVNKEEISNQGRRLSRAEKKIDDLSSVESNNDVVFDELREREARKKNLVIHQIPEPPESLDKGGQRKEHDTQKVLDIFGFLQVPVRKEGIKFIYRAGEKPDNGKPRPIILSLKNIAEKEAIMDSARNLANSNFSHISIVPDLTQRQRKDEERLRKEAERRNAEMEKDEAQNWEWVLVGTRGERRLIKRKVFVQDRRNTYQGDKSTYVPRGSSFRRNQTAPHLTGANTVQLNRSAQSILNTNRSSSQHSFSSRDNNSQTREERCVRFPNNQRGSTEARHGAPTPPSPTVMMPQSADEGGHEGEGRGDEEGDEVEIREGFNDLTTINSRATDILPSSDEEDNDDTSQQLPGEDGAEKENRKRQASKSPPAASSKKKPAKK